MSDQQQPKVTRKKISDLQPDPNNANKGTERGQKMLENSLSETGLGRSVVVDRNGYLIAGNKTTEQAVDNGFEDAIFIHTDGHELVVVQRDDLDLMADDPDNRARLLAYYDNRAGEVSLDWDAERILADLEAGVDMSKFFNARELSLLTTSVFSDQAGEDGGGQDSEFDALLEKWGTEVGQLWLIPSADGDFNHRLFIGDSTNAEHVTQLLDGATPFLMSTDPPYGVNYDASWREDYDPRWKRAKGEVNNDDEADWRQAYQLFPGAVAYVWHAGVSAGQVAEGLIESGFLLRSQIIWRKPTVVIGRGHYHWQHEPCWYAVRKGQSAQWQGGRKQSTIWEIGSVNPIGNTGEEEDKVTGHSTQKPVECMRRPIANHTVTGDGVYDPFLGSGTTLVACEQLRRQGFGMELDPRYAAVILERLEKLGLQPVPAAV